MTGWIKFFSDGTKESGDDLAISRREASWSNGRLDHIEQVLLLGNRSSCYLKVLDTEWHQFDRFIVPVTEGTHRPYRTHQVIQAKVQEEHVNKFLQCSCSGNNFFWAVLNEKKDDLYFVKQITKHHVDKWITLVLPTKDYPVISFSSKGKMRNDNKQISK